MKLRARNRDRARERERERGTHNTHNAANLSNVYNESNTKPYITRSEKATQPAMDKCDTQEKQYQKRNGYCDTRTTKSNNNIYIYTYIKRAIRNVEELSHARSLRPRR